MGKKARKNILPPSNKCDASGQGFGASESAQNAANHAPHAVCVRKPVPTLPVIFLGVAGLWLGFPNALWHVSPFALLYPLALMLLGMQARSGKEALRQGWLTGLLGASAALYWLAIPIHNVGGLPWALAFPCALLIGAYVGFYGGLFSLAAWLLGRMPTPQSHEHSKHKVAWLTLHPWRRCLALACLWYGLEVLRGSLLTGFPWLTLSTAFAPLPSFIQGASVLGSYGLSACYVLVILWLWEGLSPYLVQKNKQQRGLLTGSACVLLGLMLVFGHFALQQTLHSTQKPFDVIMVEGNVDQNVKWEPAMQEATLKLYSQLSQQALHRLREKDAQAKPLLIWPETAMPFYLEMHPTLGPALQKFIKEAHTPLLVGAPAVNRTTAGQHRPYNRTYLIDENARIQDFYDKVHLVPFGEYVPSWLLWNFLEPLLQGIGTFSSGNKAAPLRYENLAMGVLLCYESIFPHLAQERVAHGANVLINLSNDGWFGQSSAPRQHLHLASMRAVEQGRWLVRSTNTGISAIIDGHGKIVFEGAQFTAQSLTSMAFTVQKKSIFHKVYTYIPFVFLTLFLFSLLPWRRKNDN